MKKSIVYFLLGVCVGTGVFALTSYTYIRTGQDINNKIEYNVTGRFIRQGQDQYGKILYNIDGKYIRKGSEKNGQIVFNITNY